MRLKSAHFIFCLVILLYAGSIASGQCDPDGNDSAREAESIGFTQTVSDYVCPEDQFDYYYFTVPSGADVSGTIGFTAPQTGTVIRLTGSSGTVFEGSTTDADRDLSFTINHGDLAADTYYIRISFWSAYSYDHAYTIVMSLTSGGTADCLPDGNNEAENADEIAFGETVVDYVCGVDHIDIYHFEVTSNFEGMGKITLTSESGELFLYLYDSTGGELYSERTTGLSVEYTLGDSSSTLANGDYYIGVFLPLARDEENKYSLKLTSGLLVGFFHGVELFEPEETPTLGIVAVMHVLRFCPWPSQFGNPQNQSRTHKNGPTYVSPGGPDEIAYHDFGHSRSDIIDGHKYYTGLLVGPDNTAYFMEHGNKKLHAYSVTTDTIKWSKATGSYKPPVLDDSGNIYLIDAFNPRFTKMKPNGSYVYLKEFPFEGEPAVELAGASRIYTSVNERELDSTNVLAWDTDGNILWQVGPVDGRIVGVAEDTANRCVYVQTGKALYKVDWEGVIVWTKRFPVARGLPPGMIGYLPPVVGPDGKVWVLDEGTNMGYIYAANGIRTHDLPYGPHTKPQSVCMDSQGYFYVANGSRLTRYRDWVYIDWYKNYNESSDFEVKEYNIGDIVVGADDNVYVFYVFKESYPTVPAAVDQYEGYWTHLDETNGDLIGCGYRTFFLQELLSINIEETPIGGGAELAIGKDNTLIFLHLSGFVAAYGDE